jgi:hypothetical protein
VKITAYDCPRISPEFLAEEKADMPENWFKSEYLGEFVDAIDSVFSHAHVMGALSDAVHPLFTSVGEPALENGRVGIDFSTLLVR